MVSFPAENLVGQRIPSPVANVFMTHPFMALHSCLFSAGTVDHYISKVN